MTRTLRTIAAVAALTISATANATIIYDGGSPNLEAAFRADTSGPFTTVAETFVLQSGASTVTDAHWWGGCFNNYSYSCPTGYFTITFYDDAEGMPGSVIRQESVGNANQTATGNLIFETYNEYSYSATFAPLDLLAGTTYWFGVSNTTNGDGWAMETTDSSAHQHAIFLTGTGWILEAADLAFNLTNDGSVPEPGGPTVPEPGTLALLGLSLAGLVAARRRKQ